LALDVAVVPDISGRVGRYPSAAQGGATWSGIIADTNMPPSNHWCPRFCMMSWA
jgi:hypothetical protein